MLLCLVKGQAGLFALAGSVEAGQG
jgi:hypothetical protein